MEFNPDQNKIHDNWYPMVFHIYLPHCGAVQMSLAAQPWLHSPMGPGSEHCTGPFVLFLFPFKHKELPGPFPP